MAEYKAVVFLLGPGAAAEGRSYLASKGIDTPGQTVDGCESYFSKAWNRDVDMVPVEDKKSGILYCPARPAICDESGKPLGGMVTTRMDLLDAEMYFGIGTAGALRTSLSQGHVIFPGRAVSSEDLARVSGVPEGYADQGLRSRFSARVRESGASASEEAMSRSILGKAEANATRGRKERLAYGDLGFSCQDMEMSGFLYKANMRKMPAAGSLIVFDTVPDDGETEELFKGQVAWPESVIGSLRACLDAAERVAMGHR